MSAGRARTSSSAGRSQAGHVQRAVAEQHLEPVAAVEQHARVAGAAAQRGGVVELAHGEHVVQAAGQPRAGGW